MRPLSLDHHLSSPMFAHIGKQDVVSILRSQTAQIGKGIFPVCMETQFVSHLTICVSPGGQENNIFKWVAQKLPSHFLIRDQQ